MICRYIKYEENKYKYLTYTPNKCLGKKVGKADRCKSCGKAIKIHLLCMKNRAV